MGADRSLLAGLFLVCLANMLLEIGTVIATVVAIYGGFTATFVLGALCYLAAGLLGARLATQLSETAR